MDRRAIEHGIHTNRTTNNEMETTLNERAGHGGRGGAGTADLGMAAVRRASGGLEATALVSRRLLLRRAAGVGVAALAVGALGPAGASGGSAKATVALNLRSGPSTAHKVLRVIPAGGIVSLQGGTDSGFSYVAYDGTYGWASSQYLGPAGGQAPPPGGGLGSTGRTTAAVNFREGPSTSARVIAVLPKGTAIFVHDVGASGFWSVAHNGRSGWIWADYVERTNGTPPPSGPVYDLNSATTTAALNLRAEPSTSAKVLLVMPSGAKVSLKSGTANGWRQVSYNGTSGWGSTAYLN